MKVLVGVKRVVDANVKVRVRPDHTNVDIENSKMSLNPFDENAIEEAVRLKEQGIVTEIIAVSIGGVKCEETLRTALARGCDRAILVKTEQELLPIDVAQVFAKIYAQENPNIVLLGKQAIDNDASQVPQMLAGILDLPQACFVNKMHINNNQAVVERETDDGLLTIEVSLPAVISADLYLNNPRFIKLPQLMMAKKKTIENIEFSELNIAVNNSIEVLSVVDGEVKKQCKMLNTVDQVYQVIQELRV